jgi:hypothetical protein
MSVSEFRHPGLPPNDFIGGRAKREPGSSVVHLEKATGFPLSRE